MEKEDTLDIENIEKYTAQWSYKTDNNYSIVDQEWSQNKWKREWVEICL